jgi:hypothetical protein
MSLNLEIRQTIDDATALKVNRERLSRPSQKVVELLSIVGATQGKLRTYN